MDRRKTIPARLYFSPTRLNSPEKGERKKLPERTASEIRKSSETAPISAPGVVLRRTRKEDPRQMVTNGSSIEPNDTNMYRRFSRKAARDFFGLRRLSR
uniref:Uncharacterized protein n=1 Tax=Acrobeloides nanus TaxID=290746 RepID=A0A914EC00_9BILA